MSNEEIKEDFSGLTEVNVKEPQSQPDELPPRIDVSEEIEKASRVNGTGTSNGNGNPQGQEASGEQFQGQSQHPPMPTPQGMHPAEHQQMMMMMGPRQPAKPSFWKTLMTRGLVVIAVLAVGFLAWWWWSSKKGMAAAAGEAVQAVGDAAKNVAANTKKALNLPPHL